MAQRVMTGDKALTHDPHVVCIEMYRGYSGRLGAIAPRLPNLNSILDPLVLQSFPLRVSRGQEQQQL